MATGKVKTEKKDETMQIRETRLMPQVAKVRDLTRIKN
jgi:hypothetical protein